MTLENNMDKKLFCISTYGCQMNEEDSEKLSGMLKSQGYERTENKEEASIIIFNTCCVRENAENKVFGNLGQLKQLKKKNPNLVIAICGCMMQQVGMADKVLKTFPYVDIIFGTHNAHKFPEYLHRAGAELQLHNPHIAKSRYLGRPTQRRQRHGELLHQQIHDFPVPLCLHASLGLRPRSESRPQHFPGSPADNLLTAP